MSEPVKAFCSKYAVASGKIQEMEVWDNGDGYAAQRGNYTLFRWNKDIHRTREGAVKAAGALRDKRLASLRAQVADLEKLSFDQ